MSQKVSSSLDYLLEYLEKTEDFTLPSYKELPGVDLYMEQVLKYVNGAIEPVTGKDNSLTSFMVNNYVKSRMISEPSKKKYSKEQIGSLIAITLMKPSLSMADMARNKPLCIKKSNRREPISSFMRLPQISWRSIRKTPYCY